MTTGWDEFQELVKAEMKKVYSETVVDHAINPRNVDNMDNYDGSARITGPCGDTMEIWLKVRNDTIIEATLMTDGCGTTIAAGSLATELAKGKTVIQAQKISQQDVLKALGGATRGKPALRSSSGKHTEGSGKRLPCLQESTMEEGL
jgi:nitrogen fixation NifU-like protein